MSVKVNVPFSQQKTVIDTKAELKDTDYYSNKFEFGNSNKDGYLDVMRYYTEKSHNPPVLAKSDIDTIPRESRVSFKTSRANLIKEGRELLKKQFIKGLKVEESKAVKKLSKILKESDSDVEDDNTEIEGLTREKTIWSLTEHAKNVEFLFYFYVIVTLPELLNEFIFSEKCLQYKNGILSKKEAQNIVSVLRTLLNKNYYDLNDKYRIGWLVKYLFRNYYVGLVKYLQDNKDKKNNDLKLLAIKFQCNRVNMSALDNIFGNKKKAKNNFIVALITTNVILYEMLIKVHVLFDIRTYDKETKKIEVTDEVKYVLGTDFSYSTLLQNRTINIGLEDSKFYVESMTKKNLRQNLYAELLQLYKPNAYVRMGNDPNEELHMYLKDILSLGVKFDFETTAFIKKIKKLYYYM